MKKTRLTGRSRQFHAAIWSLRIIAFLGTVALSSITTAKTQDADAPVFRSDTNVVTLEFGATVKRGLRGKVEPWTGLTIDEMKVVVDRKEFAPTSMTQDRPGHYMLSLDIPERYKDGKTHKVRFKVKKTTFPFTHTFKVPKPHDSAASSAK